MASEFSISVAFAIVMFLVQGVRVPTEFVHGRKVFSTSQSVIVCDFNRSGGSVISSSSESAIIQ